MPVRSAVAMLTTRAPKVVIFTVDCGLFNVYSSTGVPAAVAPQSFFVVCPCASAVP